MRRMMIALALTTLLGTGLAAQDAPAPAAPAPVAPETAQTPVPFPAGAKIGYVNFQYLVSQSRLGQQGRQQLQDLATKNETELTQLTNQIQALQNELQSQQNVLAPSVLTQKSNELTQMQRQAQFMSDSQTQAESALEQQLLQDFQEKAFPIFEQIRAERDLWAIFTTDSALAALHPGLDLSAEAVTKLDALP